MATTEKRPVIEVTGLKKQYKLGQIGGGTLTHDLQSWWARVRGKDRVLTGVHYPSDVLAGLAFGTGAAVIGFLL